MKGERRLQLIRNYIKRGLYLFVIIFFSSTAWSQMVYLKSETRDIWAANDGDLISILVNMGNSVGRPVVNILDNFGLKEDCLIDGIHSYVSNDPALRDQSLFRVDIWVGEMELDDGWHGCRVEVLDSQDSTRRSYLNIGQETRGPI